MTGFAAGHRNVGLVAAAQSGSLPDLAWLYFALVQLPIIDAAVASPDDKRLTAEKRYYGKQALRPEEQ